MSFWLGVPNNHNGFVTDLLSWHGDDTGGVRVPFGHLGDPLGEILETPLLLRLRDVAAAIARGDQSPRWLFLVGGPGNGKSQMVEEFVRALGLQLACEEQMVGLVAREFERVPTPRRVELSALGHGEILGPRFNELVRRLVIIQDASASDVPDKGAADQLAEDLLELLTEPLPDELPPAVLLCCVNRGVLAKTLRSATSQSSTEVVVDLLESITRASGLGADALRPSRPTCWPITSPKLEAAFPSLAGVVACWPMDIESLLAGYENDLASPGSEIISRTSESKHWEDGDCSGCNSQAACPFIQNARWVRDGVRRKHLIGVLRRQELASGERWNFRSLFSLAAELMVGEWEDFSVDGQGPAHPCDWVHSTAAGMRDSESATAVSASFSLVRRLYPHALFAGELPAVPDEVRQITSEMQTAGAVSNYVDRLNPSMAKSIRRRLMSSVRPLVDPARWSPEDDTEALANIEDAYSQSVSLGNASWPDDVQPAESERRLLQLLAKSDEECDAIADDLPARAALGERFMRQLAVTVAKRSVGVRIGRHAGQRYLEEYEVTIRDQDRLDTLRSLLKELLTGSKFQFNALATFGQPVDADAALVVLEANPMPISPITPAPAASASLPAHDLPAVEVAHRPVPVTFELFLALKLEEAGCASGSLPASVRAALDKIKQLYAGRVCRSEEDFIERDAHFEVDGKGSIVVSTIKGRPRFMESHGW